MNTIITLDPTVSRQLDQGMRASGGVELPFPVVYLWAHNGQPSYTNVGGALYYGGWATKADDLSEFSADQGLDIPLGFSQGEIATRGGEFLDVLRFT